MDTPSFPPFQSRPGTVVGLPRRLRIGAFIALIVLVQGTLAYLLTWFEPPGKPAFVPIIIPSYSAWSVPAIRPFSDAGSVFSHTTATGATGGEIRQTLDDLARRNEQEPVIVYLSAIALQVETGDIVVVPADATPDDPAGWLPLRTVLEKLKSCRSKRKLLVFDWRSPPALDRAGYVHHDIAAALPGELDAVPDADRLVLCACAAGQQTHYSGELAQSAFAYYFQQALLGYADGYGEARDSRVSVRELAGFVQARVERWSLHNRGEAQTPTLLGSGSDFTIVGVNHSIPRPAEPGRPEIEYSPLLSRHWQSRDSVYQSGAYRLTPRAFQVQQATILRWEQRHSDADGQTMLKTLPTEIRLQARPPDMSFTLARKSLEEHWPILNEKLAGARPADAEILKKRFIEDMRAKLPEAALDSAVFAHALADAKLDPGTLRLCDQLLHPTPKTLPRTARALRIRQLADLAMRVEVQAWPREIVETLLRCTDLGERAHQQTPCLPGYDALLEEPSLARHAGEVRLWSRGYSSLDDSRRLLNEAIEKYDRLMKLDQRWEKCARTLDEAWAELPWYVEALESLPELREPWRLAAQSARDLADTLKQTRDGNLPWTVRVERLGAQLAAAEKHTHLLQQQRQALHAPFSKDAIARLERQCRSPHADAGVRQTAEALLSVAAPVMPAEARQSLWSALQILSRRLNDETLALDRQDDGTQHRTTAASSKTPPLEDAKRLALLRAEWQLVLLELAGLPEDRLGGLREGIVRCKKDGKDSRGWSEIGAEVRELTHKHLAARWREETAWRERERLAWLMPPLLTQQDIDSDQVSPTMAHLQYQNEMRELRRRERERYVARAYQGLNLESPGIVAARSFYAQKGADLSRKVTEGEAHVRLNVAAPLEPLTEQQPYSNLVLEVTRHVPPGAFGPVELKFHHTDDVWLEVAPDSASLPSLVDSKEPRTLTHRIPLKATRKPKAERSGLPAPIGFLIEARFAGHSYHHLVRVPIVPSTQELQILVSADPDEPANTVNEINVRPGKVKQSHYVYVRNLTNRTQKVQVEINAGGKLLHKSAKLLTVEPDGVRKVSFEERPFARPTELHGPLVVRLLDADRQKVVAERTLRVEVLAPHEYVKVAEALYEPGREGNNKWAVLLQASRSVPGPAIAAQLVLPVQRIPGLMGVGGGTLQVELPTQLKSSRILFAERLRLLHAVQEEGPVYLHIDGVPRAFVYRTTFSRAGEATLPTRDDRPAVRLLAPTCVMAGVNCLVDVEVDNAPRGARLEVALGRSFDTHSFKAEMVREFSHAKKSRIDLESSKNALVFDATIGDWTATFDTRAIVGLRELRARLIDIDGKEIALSRQSLVIDDSPPIAHIVPTPAQAKKGALLQVQAQGVDPESGVAQVVFFYGKPDKGEIPPNSPRFKATPANRQGTQWTATLQIPAFHNGPLAISVYVVNHAGMASIDTATLDVTDHEPGKTGRGEVRGKVLEGARLQPNLLVTLLDERGNEIARTKTQPDGTYLFTQIAPGTYRVLCVKPESQRRAVLGVTVEPDRSSRADLALSL